MPVVARRCSARPWRPEQVHMAGFELGPEAQEALNCSNSSHDTVAVHADHLVATLHCNNRCVNYPLVHYLLVL
jgi:hypothetical protein